jgi:hypothetical protein
MIYLSLVQMCYVTKKFRMMKDLLVDIKSILNVTLQGQPGKQDINIQKLKTLI